MENTRKTIFYICVCIYVCMYVIGGHIFTYTYIDIYVYIITYKVFYNIIIFTHVIYVCDSIVVEFDLFADNLLINKSAQGFLIC